MDIKSEYITYDSTGHFTPLTIDYVNGNEKLQQFYNYPVSDLGVQQSIAGRKNFPVNRLLLVNELRKQYNGITLTMQQEQYLQALLQDNCFTICTAHQPVIFTGPLYFIYKIFHAIKLADKLAKKLPAYKFVPVFYMGSEDADLDELGHINMEGQKLVWQTNQKGAVGRMVVDKALLKMIEQLAGQIGVEPFGKELIALFRSNYQEGETIQQATFKLVNELFKVYGLLIVVPDNAVLKMEFANVVKKELSDQFSHTAAAETIKELSVHYKAQAGGRDINLFYLKDNNRERIEKVGEGYVVKAIKLQFSKEEIMEEVEMHPERFSPNVILRPLFQEMILPNIIFIGGGGETAYWLELKKVFEAAGVHFPMLLLRNSFLFVNKEQEELAAKIGFSLQDLFKPKVLLVNELVKKESPLQLNLSKEKAMLRELYETIQGISGKVNHTLAQHTAALEHRAIEKLDALEKKMLRAEKRKFETQQRQIEKLKQQLFPYGGLQERNENFSILYSKYGKLWMQAVYDSSLGLDQQFGIVEMMP